MSRKADKKAIGLFVVSAIVLLLIGIMVFGSGMLFKQADKYILFFDGSIKGLSAGAPVIFRGVQIGAVKQISLVYDSKYENVLIPVVIEVELSRVKGIEETLGYPDYKELVDQGLRAKLEVQNFITGQLMIGFDFFPDKPAKLYGIEKDYPELPTLPISPDLFEIVEGLPIQAIASNLERAVAGINRLINSGGLLDKALMEAGQAARSIRLLVEYLEQHPEALLKGKAIPKGE